MDAEVVPVELACTNEDAARSGPTRCFLERPAATPSLSLPLFKNVASIDVIRIPGAGASTPAGSAQKLESGRATRKTPGAHVRSHVMEVSFLNTRCDALLAPAGSTPMPPQSACRTHTGWGSGGKPVNSAVAPHGWSSETTVPRQHGRAPAQCRSTVPHHQSRRATCRYACGPSTGAGACSSWHESSR